MILLIIVYNKRFIIIAIIMIYDIILTYCDHNNRVI